MTSGCLFENPSLFLKCFHSFSNFYFFLLSFLTQFSKSPSRLSPIPRNSNLLCINATNFKPISWIIHAKFCIVSFAGITSAPFDPVNTIRASSHPPGCHFSSLSELQPLHLLLLSPSLISHESQSSFSPVSCYGNTFETVAQNKTKFEPDHPSAFLLFRVPGATFFLFFSTFISDRVSVPFHLELLPQFSRSEQIKIEEEFERTRKRTAALHATTNFRRFSLFFASIPSFLQKWKKTRQNGTGCFFF